MEIPKVPKNFFDAQDAANEKPKEGAHKPLIDIDLPQDSMKIRTLGDADATQQNKGNNNSEGTETNSPYKEFDEDTEENKSRFGQFLNVMLVLAVVGLAAYSGLLWYQKQELSENVTRLQTSIENTQQSIIDLKEKRNVGDEIVSADILKKATEQRILWSEVVEEVLAQQTNSVQLVNFSSDKERRITAIGTADDLDTVANMLESLRKYNVQTTNPFVTSMAERKQNFVQGVDAKDLEKKVQFQLQFDYVSNPENNE